VGTDSEGHCSEDGRGFERGRVGEEEGEVALRVTGEVGVDKALSVSVSTQRISFGFFVSSQVSSSLAETHWKLTSSSALRNFFSFVADDGDK
jgi:hypothetical protein